WRASRPLANVLYAVAEAADCFDQLAGGAKLGAESLNVHVHGAGLNVTSRLPDNFQQQIATLYSSLSFGEEQKELELGRREIAFAAVDCVTMSSTLDPP